MVQYSQEAKTSKYKADNEKHLSLFIDIFFPIQPENLKYHVCKTCCPKISLIQRWTNQQLQYEKYFLVGMRKSQWFSLSFFLSHWFVTVLPSQMSLSHCISLSNMIFLYLNKWDMQTFSFEFLLHIKRVQKTLGFSTIKSTIFYSSTFPYTIRI